MQQRQVVTLVEHVLTFMAQKEREALLQQAEDEVVRLRRAGWTQQDFAGALKHLLEEKQ